MGKTDPAKAGENAAHFSGDFVRDPKNFHGAVRDALQAAEDALGHDASAEDMQAFIQRFVETQDETYGPLSNGEEY